MTKETKQRTRDSFSKSLERIVAPIAGGKVFTVEEKASYIDEKYISEFRVKRLRVFGSWSRGALKCSDLDLLAEIEELKGRPSTNKVEKAIKLNLKDVHIAIGTEKKNSAHIEISDAKVIWSKEKSDWKLNIEKIQANSSAGRMRRKYDELPLGPDNFTTQRGGDKCVYEEIVDLRDSGFLVWEFVDYESLSPTTDTWDQNVLDRWTRMLKWGRLGKKTAESLEYVIQWVSTHQPLPNLPILMGGTRHQIRGNRIFIGVPPLPNMELLDDFRIHRIIVAPHRTRMGPNGLWIIRRGKKHPVRRLFKDIHLWHAGKLGKPIFQIHDCNYNEAVSVELFNSEKSARNDWATYGEDLTIEISSVTNGDVIEILEKCDVIELMTENAEGRREPESLLLNSDVARGVEEWESDEELSILEAEELAERLKIFQSNRSRSPHVD